jgi:predicted phage terminase large subunit-like protein
MPDIKLVLPRLHAGQKTIVSEARRFNVLACGRRFGKTTLGGNLLAPVVLEGRPAAWFAPTYRLLEEAYQHHKRIYAPVVSRAVSTPAPRIELITGGVIDYWTLDDPSTVARGRKYGRVIIDEAAMARHLEQAWTEAIRPTLTDYAGDAYFLSTPKGDNYFAQMFRLCASDPEWAAWQMPTTANPYIDPVEVGSAAASLPSLAYRQEYLAEFVDAAGARVKREWIRTGEPPAGLPVYLGVDLAISLKAEADYTAVVAISRGDDGTIYILDAARTRSDFAAVLRFVEAMAAKWNPVLIGIEQVQYQAAVVQELLRRTKLPVRGIRPDRDKVTRFAPLEARYEQGQVVHAHGLPGWFADELLSFPVGRHDDAVDAAGYAWIVHGLKRSWAAG